MKSLFLSIYLLLAGICHAQKYGQDKADSLIKVLKTEAIDTNRIALMADISTTFYPFDIKQQLRYAEEALELAEKRGWQKGIALSYHAFGLYNHLKPDHQKALDYYSRAGEIFHKLGNKSWEAKCLCYAASTYTLLSDISKTLEYALKSTQLYQQAQDSLGLAIAYGIIGYAYGKQSDYSNAELFYNKALFINKRFNQVMDYANVLSAMGNMYLFQSNYAKALEYLLASLSLFDKLDIGFSHFVQSDVAYAYLMLKDYDKAKSYYNKALVASQKQKDTYAAAHNLESLGTLHKEQNNLALGLEYMKKALAMYKEINNDDGLAVTYGDMGDVYGKLGQYEKALHYLSMALELDRKINMEFYLAIHLRMIGHIYLQLANSRSHNALQVTPNQRKLLQKAENYLSRSKAFCKKTEDVNGLQLVLKDLSEVQQLQGNSSEALATYKEHAFYKDSVFNIEKRNDFTRQEMAYEYGKKQDSLKLVTDKKEAVNTSELKLQQKATQVEKQNKRLAFISILVLMLISIFIYYLFWQRKKLSNQLAVSLITLKDTQARLIKIETEKEGEKVRQEISRDLHDDLGSDLYKISLLSEMMKPQLSGKGKDTIDKIATSAKNSLEKMGEIVWTINTAQDDLSNLIAYFRKFAMEYFELADIECRITLPVNVPGKLISGQKRRGLLLSYKEALRNVVRHAEAKAVDISFYVTDRQLCICIHDNGKGMDVATGHPIGNGLTNMQKRMEEAGGSFAWENHNGTSITLTVAVDKLGGSVDTSL